MDYSKSLYGNCSVLNVNGDLMFRCNEKKLNWYLSRNLAKLVKDKVGQLLFAPAGPGHAGIEFYVSEKVNQCVVCGSDQKLTKHHVVPRCYRRFFPPDRRDHLSYDVLLLCENCHETYEFEADKLKSVIIKEYQIVEHGQVQNRQLTTVRNAACALQIHRDKMPAKRIEELMNRLKLYYGTEINDDHIEKASKLVCIKVDKRWPGGYVVDKIDNLDDFINRWRNHFVSVMNPQFLPKGWAI